MMQDNTPKNSYMWRREITGCLLLVFMLLAVHGSALTQGTTVVFPDSNLSECIRFELDVPHDSLITDSLLLTLTSLNCSEQDISKLITNLSGLEHASKLETLKLGNNKITDIEPLAGLTKLTELKLEFNKITNINALESLTVLKILWLHGSQGSNDNDRIKNIRPLRKMNDLVNLDLSQQSVRDDQVRYLAGKPNLKLLKLINNDITTIQMLTDLPALETLYLNGNKISNVQALSGLTSLKTLWLHGNKISVLPRLQSLTNLQTLHLEDNILAEDDLLSLHGLNVLKFLDIRFNPDLNSGKAMQVLADNLDLLNCDQIVWDGCCGIEDCFADKEIFLEIVRAQLDSAGTGMPHQCINRTDILALKSLDARNSGSGQQIDSIQGLENAVNLERLLLNGNLVHDISPLEPLDNLRRLSLDDNAIDDISFLNDLFLLDSLSINDNDGPFSPLGSLGDLRKLRNLTTLSLMRGGVKNIGPLLKLENLTTLRLRGNQIAQADSLQNMRLLEVLDLGENALDSTFGLADKQLLDTLYLDNNNLKEVLNLAGLTKLKGVSLDSNQLIDKDLASLFTLDDLTFLDLSRNSALTDTAMQKLADELAKMECDDIVFDRCCGIESYFKENDLRECVRNALTQIGDSTYHCINRQDILKLKRLDASGLDIRFLHGLELAKNLTYLDLRGNKIEILEALEELTKIDTLMLGDNSIDDLGLLENLTTLEYLDLENNEIATLKIRTQNALANLTELRWLNLGHNELGIEDLPDLYGLDRLDFLDLRSNADITGIVALTAICNLAVELEDATFSDIFWDSEGLTVEDCGNIKPNPPEITFNGQSVYKCDAVQISVEANDEDGDPLKVKVFWGDGSSPEYSDRLPGGSTFHFQHLYDEPGTYMVTAVSEDGLVESEPSVSNEVIIVDEVVTPPTFDPPPGPFVGSFEVRIRNTNNENRGAIHYTLEGRDPTREDPEFEPNSSAIVVSDSQIIRAAVFFGDCDTSEVVSASYRILPRPGYTGVTAPGLVDALSKVPITISMSQYDSAFSAILLYRRGGESDWDSLTLTNEESKRLRGTIPDRDSNGFAVDERGVEFSLKLKLNDRPVELEPPFGKRVIRVRSNSLARTERTEEDDYQMISIPNALIERSPFALFGEYGDYMKDWRLVRWQDDGVDVGSDYLEYSSLQDTLLDSGEAYWLITRTPQRVQTDTAVSRSTNVPFPIDLNKGWNQIGNPFYFPVSWDSIAKPAGVVERPRRWNPKLKDYVSDPSDILAPWEGYFVMSKSAARIEINPREASANLLKSQRSIADQLNIAENDWIVQLAVTSKAAQDRGNYLGFIDRASETWDQLDFSEPPSIGNYVSAYFPHRDWKVNPRNYTGDFRPPSPEGEIWDFEVRTNILNEEITLSLANAWQFPSDWKITLHDESGQRVETLSAEQSYDFYPISTSEPHRFRLMIGAADFIEKQDPNFAKIPTTPVLFPSYPNPFAAEGRGASGATGTQVRYAVPEDMLVSVKVYAITGREVRTLVDSYRSRGIYTTSWNGRNTANNRVASGVYLLRMQAGRHAFTRKMILQR